MHGDGYMAMSLTDGSEHTCTVDRRFDAHIRRRQTDPTPLSAEKR